MCLRICILIWVSGKLDLVELYNDIWEILMLWMKRLWYIENFFEVI